MIKVSVCVITFNQQAYIEKCLTSIVAQEVNFPIEIIVSDDCSTDDTWEIIRKFAVKHKNILCFRHEENVGMMKNLSSTLSKCSGEFIAICEGDDFWYSSNKLIEQVYFAEINNNFGMLIHRAFESDDDNNIGNVLFDKGDAELKLSLSDVLSHTGQFSPTASYFFKRCLLSELPDWFKTATVGDLFIEIYSTKLGPIFYMPKTYCCYRTHSVGSWSFQARRFDYKKNLERSKKFEIDLRKCAKDFPDYVDLFNVKISESLTAQAESYIMLSDYHNFKNVIAESIELSRFANRTQFCMSTLQKFPYLLKLAIKLKHWLISR
ncbi:glycosyltransferase family 2 protein [Shewanella chilikensis]|uniref:glycosyltransferase family 2 protein n=1 Tax=Shewanella chilikensis TaxID=558541 RepID=UPI00399A34D9